MSITTAYTFICILKGLIYNKSTLDPEMAWLHPDTAFLTGTLFVDVLPTRVITV